MKAFLLYMVFTISSQFLLGFGSAEIITENNINEYESTYLQETIGKNLDHETNFQDSKIISEDLFLKESNKKAHAIDDDLIYELNTGKDDNYLLLNSHKSSKDGEYQNLHSENQASKQGSYKEFESIENGNDSSQEVQQDVDNLNNSTALLDMETSIPVELDSNKNLESQNNLAADGGVNVKVVDSMLGFKEDEVLIDKDIPLNVKNFETNNSENIVHFDLQSQGDTTTMDDNETDSNETSDMESDNEGQEYNMVELGDSKQEDGVKYGHHSHHGNHGHHYHNKNNHHHHGGHHNHQGGHHHHKGKIHQNKSSEEEIMEMNVSNEMENSYEDRGESFVDVDESLELETMAELKEEESWKKGYTHHQGTHKHKNRHNNKHAKNDHHHGKQHQNKKLEETNEVDTDQNAANGSNDVENDAAELTYDFAEIDTLDDSKEAEAQKYGHHSHNGHHTHNGKNGHSYHGKNRHHSHHGNHGNHSHHGNHGHHNYKGWYHYPSDNIHKTKSVQQESEDADYNAALNIMNEPEGLESNLEENTSESVENSSTFKDQDNEMNGNENLELIQAKTTGVKGVESEEVDEAGNNESVEAQNKESAEAQNNETPEAQNNESAETEKNKSAESQIEELAEFMSDGTKFHGLNEGEVNNSSVKVADNKFDQLTGGSEEVEFNTILETQEVASDGDSNDELKDYEMPETKTNESAVSQMVEGELENNSEVNDSLKADAEINQMTVDTETGHSNTEAKHPIMTQTVETSGTGESSSTGETQISDDEIISHSDNVNGDKMSEAALVETNTSADATANNETTDAKATSETSTQSSDSEKSEAGEANTLVLVEPSKSALFEASQLTEFGTNKLVEDCASKGANSPQSFIQKLKKEVYDKLNMKQLRGTVI